MMTHDPSLILPIDKKCLGLGARVVLEALTTQGA